MVSVRKDDVHYCAGTFIDNGLILTAANCIYKILDFSLTYPFELFSVSLGSILRKYHYIYDVINIDTHKDYKWTNFTKSNEFSPYDIGLILVSRYKLYFF